MPVNIVPVQYKHRLIAAFVIILLLWVGMAVWMDLEAQYLLDKTVLRYSMYFGWLLLVTLSGYFAWKKDKNKWVAGFWLRIYCFVLIVLLLAGFCDIYIYPFSYQLKMYVQSFRLFFLSPVPLVLLYFFPRLAQRGPHKR